MRPSAVVVAVHSCPSTAPRCARCNRGKIRKVAVRDNPLCLRERTSDLSTLWQTVKDLELCAGSPKLLTKLFQLTTGLRAFVVSLLFDVRDQLAEG